MSSIPFKQLDVVVTKLYTMLGPIHLLDHVKNVMSLVFDVNCNPF